jgi:hypothetical protein
MRLHFLSALTAIVSLLGRAGGEESLAQPAEQPSEEERRVQIIQETAEAYALFDAERAEQPLVRSEKPVLKFEDPVTMATRGGVYVWSDHRGRPRAIASIYFRGDGARVDEFQSLAEAGLVAKYQGEVVWRPVLAGVEWTSIAGEVPATKPLRLAKMREIARQFAAAVRDAKAGRQELRLLTQPLYRYDDADRGIVDGALFCYAKGTNPEVLLLVQAETSEGRTQWKQAFCRMTERECEVKSGERVVWSAAKAPIPQPPEDPYFNRTTR